MMDSDLPSREVSIESDGRLSTGAFVLSWDFELAWGYRHQDRLPPKFYANDPSEVVTTLIDILDEAALPATWATVGQLFQEEATAELPPLETAQDYKADSRNDAAINELRTAPDLINRLDSCRSQQELGCHTYTHTTTDVAERILRNEFEAFEAVYPDDGTPRSFVSPRHSAVPRRLLQEFGYTCYREPFETPPIWRALAFYTGISGPSTGLPERDKAGLWRIPSGTYFFYEPLSSFQRRFPILKRRWLQSGLDRATVRGEVFHVWAHPHNFIDDDHALSQFQWLIQEVRRRWEKGDIVPLTMAELAEIFGKTEGRYNQ